MKMRGLLINLGLIFSLLCCLAFACKSGDEGTTGDGGGGTGAPSEAEIKRMVEAEWNPENENEIEFQSIKMLSPEQSGDVGLEGMPAGRKTTYYPVRIQFIRTRHTSNPLIDKPKEFDGIFNFWRGLDGEWTYNVSYTKS